MKKCAVFGIAVLSTVIIIASAISHCQIPCGIYDDSMRFAMMREHCDTLEKSMNQINELSSAQPANYNQLVRWVNNKEQHADYLIDIITDYFMLQRVKLPESTDEAVVASYHKKLAVLHNILIAAMKCKQTTDPAHVAAIRQLVDEFEHLYFGKEAKEHMEHEHAH
ncbi:MAG: superoxide dismutase [Candidatus Auribacter fodinae]|jgi:nickel superoxide dismutase|uniref:Superoxide dismutase n=1 Tax=Candidatus Auribacter fodinae TaxID=2093366 RepID=A0A3A4R721_9BACT|nr:MAG: superoxide dismutase [Candidatus Auribacter fodinae]